MADISLNTDIELKQIKAPGLDSAEYGKNIKEQFQNIDNNFMRLSNADYVSGKKGSSIHFDNLHLYANGVFTDLGCAMLDAIYPVEEGEPPIDWNGDYQDRHPALAEVTYKDLSGNEYKIEFLKYIKENPVISVMYTLIDTESNVGDTEADDSNRIYICSPQVYTFLDSRFANTDEAGGISSATFDSQVDMSCLLTLKWDGVSDEWVPVFTKANLFPTLYYDGNDNQFKWKIYGQETGVRAMGPKGDNGSKSAVWLVQVKPQVISEESIGGIDLDNDPSMNTFKNPVEITHVMITNREGSDSTWTPIENIDADDKPKTGDLCIALQMKQEEGSEYSSDDSSDDGTLYDAFISPIIIGIIGDDIAYYAYCNYQNAINKNISTQDLINKLSNIYPGMSLGGLFIPIDDPSNVSGRAHFIYNSETDLYIRTVDHKDEALIYPADALGNISNAVHLEYDKVYVGRGSNSKLFVNEIGTKTGGISISCGSNTSINGQETSISGRNVNISAVEATNIFGNVNIQAGVGSASNGTVKATVNNVGGVLLGCPVGTIVMWAGAVSKSGSQYTGLPDGWLLCDGDLKNIAAYPTLFSVIGHTYDGSTSTTNFRVPNLQQRFPLGAQQNATIAVGAAEGSQRVSTKISTSIGATGGASEVTLIEEQMPEHNHSIKQYGGNSTTSRPTGDTTHYEYGGNYKQSTGWSADTITTDAGGSHWGTFAHNNTPPFLAINFIIKYK